VDDFVSECLFTVLSSHIVIVIFYLQYDKFVFVDGSAVSLTTNAQNYDTTILSVGGSQQGKTTMWRLTVAISMYLCSHIPSSFLANRMCIAVLLVIVRRHMS